ncbi:uncharacterized protein EMH_0075600 [Eimeria mitis]|uniref:Uncharacterized protein n=1 Tax=Eimeria mitis TaxID=44415 RepID=U6K455_9EIME|nr:uncharacterized protein EMH_0075600 [Eimeria mitis]CDJ32505.1 hypothetical protein, conserved [Eimeria mitis]
MLHPGDTEMPWNRQNDQPLACSSLQRLRCMTKRDCISVIAFELWRQWQNHVGFPAFLSTVDTRDPRTTGRLIRTTMPPHMGARRSDCTELTREWTPPQKDKNALSVLGAGAVQLQAEVCSSAPSGVEIERSCVVPGDCVSCIGRWGWGLDPAIWQSEGSGAARTLARLLNGIVSSIGFYRCSKGVAPLGPGVLCIAKKAD